MKITINNQPLSIEQLQPILEDARYSLILAGAGSGKTITLVGKVKYLLEVKKIKPEQICCISFTNEATNHLKEVIEQNTKKNVPCFTFHKLALAILEKAHTYYQITPPNTLEKITDEFFASECMGNVTLKNIIFRKFSFGCLHNSFNYQKIIHSKDFLTYKTTLLTFLHLFYANGFEKKDFVSMFSTKKRATKDTLTLLYTLHTLYQTEKESIGAIDFDDMLKLATQVLSKTPNLVSYQYILVDEFQDSSLLRFHFLNEILCQTSAHFCAVGDDYQSIYRFSGCNLDLFLHFKEYFPTGKIYSLTMTYRNSQNLIDIANTFICKNPYQMKKNLTSLKSKENPIKIWETTNEKETLKNIILTIPNEKEIMILGRNHQDFALYKSFLIETFPHKTFRFYTIHAAKGLESDIVIMLHLEKGPYGFPSELKEEKILSLVKQNDIFPYEEERRLFYVALTRTKEDVHLLVSKKSPSIFIKELKNIIKK